MTTMFLIILSLKFNYNNQINANLVETDLKTVIEIFEYFYQHRLIIPGRQYIL